MKKLLLTLLGASLLCGLSPHPLSAQETTPEEKTITFDFSATTETGVPGDPKKNVYENGLVAAGHRIKAVIPKYGDPTDFTIDTTDPVKTLTSAPAGNKSYGWGRLDLKTSETSPTIHVDFDFSRCIPAQEMPFLYTNALSSDLSFKKQDNNPGTAFSISLDKGKRIKSIRLDFDKFSYQNTDLSTYGLKKYLGFIKTIEGFGSENASSEYKTVPHENNKFFDYATYTATDPNGTDKPLYLQLIYKSDELRITSISVTYIEGTDNLPKFTNRFYVGKKYGTPIFYRVENSDEWIEAKGSETTISGSKVYVKLGNSITEFTAPSNPKPGQPTAIINAVDYQIGTTLGCTFRSYLDNPTDKAYEVRYLISEMFPSGTKKAYRIIDNITPCSTAFNRYEYALFQNMDSEELYTVWNPDGLGDTDFLTAAAKYSCTYVIDATQKQKDGMEACVIFDGLELAYTSNNPCVPGTAKVILPKAFGAKTASGKYIIHNPGEAVISAYNDPLFTSTKTYYILGDEALDADSFNKDKATYVDGQSTILIDGSKSNLAIRTYAIASDGETEVVSEVKNITFEKNEVTVIEKASQLTADLNGKTVQLNFPISVLASGTLGSDKKQYMMYARDPENDPVIMVSRVSEIPSTVDGYIPGSAFKAPTSNFIADVGFIPAGGAIGKVEVDEHGHVILVIKDTDGKDSFGSCFAGAPLTYNDPEVKAVGINMNYARKANTYLKVNEIKPEQYGRMVWLRNVKYDETDGFTINDAKIPFELKDGNEENPLFLESENGVYHMYSSTPSASENLSLCGIVEYDVDKGYYLMVRNFIPMQPVPTVTPNSSQYSEFTENEAKTEGTAYIKRTNQIPNFSVTLKKGSDNTTKFYYDFIDNTGNHFNVLANSNIISLSSNAWVTIDDIGLYKNFYNHGVATLSIESHDATTNSAATSVIPSDRSDAYTLTVIDNLISSDEYASMNDLAKVETNKFATVKTPYSFDYQAKNSGTWPMASVMIAYIRGDYMLVRDVIRNDDTSLADTQTSNADFHLVKLRSSRMSGTAQYRTHYIYPEGNGDDTGKAYQASNIPREGDGIAKASGQVINENGNVVFDLNTSYGNTNTKAFILDIDKLDFLFTAQFNCMEELFSAQLGSLRYSSVVENPDEIKVGKESIGKIIEIKGATIEANPESGSYSITLGGVKRELSWFDNDANAASNKSLIDKGGKFDITVYVMNNGADDIELKVLTLIPQAQLIDICDHPHHATYYGNHSLEDEEDGKIIRLRGIKIFKPETEYYTTLGNQDISFVWETFPENQATDINNIAVTQITPVNLYASTSLHEVTGMIKHIDGDIKLDILSIKKTGVQNVRNYGKTENNIALSFDGTFQSFYTSTVSTIRLNNIIDYKEMTVKAPEWSQVSYLIFSENGTALDNPEWKPLASDESLRIDKPSVIFVSGCSPDHITQTVVKVEATMNTNMQETDHIHQIIDKSNTSNYLHHVGKVRVAAAATLWPIGHIMAVTDDNGHYIWLQSNKYSPEVGSMMSDFALQTTLNNPDIKIGNINNSYWFRLTRDPENCKYTPADNEVLPDIQPLICPAINGENIEKYIKLIDIKIAENEDGSLKATDSSDEGNAISLNNIFDCEIADNSADSKYILSGILMPKPGKSVSRTSDEQDINALADGDEETAPLTLDDMEFVPLSIEKKRPTAAATFEVTGEESREDNQVITVGDVTVSMACADDYSKIEYSTDGGTTWIEYTQPLTISESTALKARTSAPGYDVTEVTLDIKREYYSEEAVIAAEQKSGYTAVTFAAGENASADTDFTVYYTLDGTEPDMNSAKFTAGMKPIELTEASNVKALMVEEGKRPARSIAAQAVAVRANDLEITSEKGEGFTTVTIAPKDPKHVNPKAEIRYTTDGTEPTPASQLYTAPFEVEAADNGMTVKAICIEPQKTDGLVATRTVAVEGLRPSCDVTIAYREEEGVYYITLTAEDGTIHYSLNGAEEKIYDGNPIEYTPATDGTCTVTAYALEEGKRAGKTATESFAVTGISGVGADEAESVRVEGNTIIVPEGAQTFDIAGRRVNPQGLPRGIYIVRLASGKAVKAVVK